MQELALVSFLRAEHVKKLQELNYRIISNILHVIITFNICQILLINLYFQFLLKHTPYPFSSNSNIHFNKFTSTTINEISFTLSCSCFGQQCLASSRRTINKHSLSQSSSYFLILERILKIINDFPQLIFGFIHSVNIIEFVKSINYWLGLIVNIHGKGIEELIA